MASKLEFISLGLVAQDKVKDDFELLVYPIELSPNITGDITEKIQVSGKNTDSSGSITDIKVEKKKTIKAIWLPDGASNRSTPPDMTMGMTVRLFNYAGGKDYYWSALYNDFDLAKQEKVVWFFSNKKELTQNDPELLEKGYTFTVDTYDKYVKLHTSNNDGEAVVYDLEVDAANGVITIKDDLENMIELRSQDGKLSVTLKGEMIVNTEKTYALTAKEGITVTTEKNVEVKLDKLSFKNEKGELIDLLVQLLDANINEMHVGNMGANTMLTVDSQQKYTQIKQKLESFKI